MHPVPSGDDSALLGIGLGRRVPLRRSRLPVAVFALAGIGEVLLWRLFPDGGRFPFHIADLLAGSAFCLLGLAMTWRLDNQSAFSRFWQPAIHYLERHLRPGFRVEVVPTTGHWESYWLPHEGIPLARGWYKQVDELDNPALYNGPLDATAYRLWLRGSAVAYIVVPATPLDPSTGGPAEAGIVHSPASGLTPVFRNQTSIIYRLPNPTPLVTGPGRVRVTAFTQTTIAAVASRPGRYLVRSHFSPYLRLTATECVAPAPNDMTLVELRRPGTFTVSVPSSADALVDELTSRKSSAR